MPTKKTAAGREYEIDGRRLTWHADVWEDEGESPFDITIPLRFKVKALRPIKSLDLDDPGVMLEMLEQIIPEQAEQLDNMDINDVQDMVGAWFDEYNALNGATLGEASSSSA